MRLNVDRESITSKKPVVVETNDSESSQYTGQICVEFIARASLAS